MPRSRQSLLFGGGLDRSTGVMAVEESSFYDLRNCYLYDGKAELRKGFFETLTFFSDEEVFGCFPIRSQGAAAILTWKASTREIKLYRANGTGTSTIYVGVLWTLGAGAAFPKVSGADSYGKLYLAHDEVVYANRQATRIYDPTTDTITTLQADLYTPDVGLADVKFRIVARHLNYLCGAGYGTENDPDRPEIVRISLPGEPESFNPQHYIICGQRNEPVIGLASVGDILMARKEADSYVIFGENRFNFGVRQADDVYGVIANRLMITVGGTNYFWSLEGPRVSQGGSSTDLSTLLDLIGPIPDAVAVATAAEYGFCVYDSINREILFVFGAWAYVLHVRDPNAPRWSYRKYGVSFAGGGMIFSGVSGSPAGGGGGGGGGGAGAPTAFPTITGVVVVGNTGFDITWTNDGGLLGGELAEIWVKPSLFGPEPYVLAKDNIAVAGAGQTESVTGLTPAVYAIAVRFKLVGVYTPGYTSSDPSNWPAVSQSSATLAFGYDPPSNIVAAGFCAGTTPSVGYSFTINDGFQTRVQVSTDGAGTWTDLALVVHPTNSGDFVIDYYPTYYWLRFRHESFDSTTVSDWVVVEVGSMPEGTCG